MLMLGWNRQICPSQKVLNRGVGGAARSCAKVKVQAHYMLEGSMHAQGSNFHACTCAVSKPAYFE